MLLNFKTPFKKYSMYTEKYTHFRVCSAQWTFKDNHTKKQNILESQNPIYVLLVSVLL